MSRKSKKSHPRKENNSARGEASSVQDVSSLSHHFITRAECAACISRQSANEGETSILAIRDWIFLMALIAAVILAYQPAWSGGFLWDDSANVTDPDLRSWDGLYRIWFVPGATQQYYPIVHSLFWIEHKLWGEEVFNYHIVNILLHAASAAILFLILRRLAIPGAHLAVAVFALHPVQVESVAWITELKNTLSGVFYLSAALIYLQFDRQRRPLYYCAAFCLFFMALASKTAAVTWPAAMLVIFWWQRGRLSWRQDIMPLFPFFAIAGVAGLFTIWVERTIVGAQGEAFHLTVVEHFLIAGRAICFYLGKLLWPFHLTFVYPRWRIDSSAWLQYLFPAAVLLLLSVAWALRHRWRGPLAALLFFIGTLLPVLGFFNVYLFNYTYVADHFQYLPSLGVIVLFSALLTMLLNRLNIRRPAGYAFYLALATFLACMTSQQSRMYADGELLYRTTIERNPDCWMAHNNLGVAMLEKGQIKDAISHFDEVIKIKPDFPNVYQNMGCLFLDRGDNVKALEYFHTALKYKPRDALAYNNIGIVYARQNQMDEAEKYFREAVTIKPRFIDARMNLCRALEEKGGIREAIGFYHDTLAIKPNMTLGLSKLSWLLSTSADPSLRNGAEAVELAQKAVQLSNGRDLAAFDCLGAAYAEVGRYSEAAEAAQRAVMIAMGQNHRDILPALNARLALYKSNRPFHNDAANPP
jgi:protein O-mannosyl-transferase